MPFYRPSLDIPSGLPVYSDYDASSQEVRVIFHKLLRHFLKRLQVPDLIVTASIQLICLHQRENIRRLENKKIMGKNM